MVDGPRQVMGGGAELAGSGHVGVGLGLQAVAVERGGPIGPVADPLLGPARGALVGTEAAEQVVGLPQVAAGLALALLLRRTLPLDLGDGRAVGRRRLRGEHGGQPEADQD